MSTESDQAQNSTIVSAGSTCAMPSRISWVAIGSSTEEPSSEKDAPHVKQRDGRDQKVRSQDDANESNAKIHANAWSGRWSGSDKINGRLHAQDRWRFPIVCGEHDLEMVRLLRRKWSEAALQAVGN